MLPTFHFDEHAVRVHTDPSGVTWFNASDVCKALEMGNPSQAIKQHVDADDIQKLDALTAGGRQLQNHVNESGLYALIFGSNKESAKRFKRWVTRDVLPAIRKSGTYSAPSIVVRRASDAISAMDAARIYCKTFRMACDSGMDSDAAKQLAAQTKYEASGWWWQFRDPPKNALLAAPTDSTGIK